MTPPLVSPAPPLEGDRHCEVAIVGAGYTGLSAALHLARDHGIEACVLDAGEPGWGASGRNGGFCCLYPSALTLAQLDRGFGTDATDEFLPHNWGRPFVAYTGTHDNATVRGWWDTASERERAFAGSYLPANEGDIHWAMIRACCNSVANMAVFPLQDVLGLGAAHRMNIPGTMGDHNWSWRFTWEMIDAESTRVLGLITAASGRGPIALARLP